MYVAISSQSLLIDGCYCKLHSDIRELSQAFGDLSESITSPPQYQHPTQSNALPVKLLLDRTSNDIHPIVQLQKGHLLRGTGGYLHSA
jgi:hypothetical protein